LLRSLRLYAGRVPAISFFVCSRCHRQVSAATPAAVCPACAGPLCVRYDLEALKSTAKRPGPNDIASMWRYADVLPDVEPVTLGEGWTPLLPSRRYPSVLLKDEANNPTGSVNARGMSVAVSVARQDGRTKLAIAASGNTASAFAAYAAAAGMDARIFMSRDVPMPDYVEGILYGAQVTFFDGPMLDGNASQGSFDISDPFRIEGMKTLGYELVEQLGWNYPDAVIHPASVGRIAMPKAFDEMEQLGWVSGRRPKRIAVQCSRGSAPDSSPVEIARDSGDTVVDVSDEAMLASLRDWAQHEGLLLSPEGAAAAAAYHQLLAGGFLKPADRVVLLNPASALRSIDRVAQAIRLNRPLAKRYPQRTPVGGIITPQ